MANNFGKDNYKTNNTRRLVHKSKKGINKGGKYLYKDGVKNIFMEKKLI